MVRRKNINIVELIKSFHLTTALILIFTVGLKDLQRAAIVTAFPFIFVMLLSCFSLVKALKKKR